MKMMEIMNKCNQLFNEVLNMLYVRRNHAFAIPLHCFYHWATEVADKSQRNYELRGNQFWLCDT